MSRRLAPAPIALALLAAGASFASAQLPLTFAAPARIVYEADGSIYTIGADGSDRRRVLGPGTADPAWSPDGGSIAYVEVLDELEDPAYENEDFGTAQIKVAAADGSGARALGEPKRSRMDGSPTWSPDGQRIAFVRVRASTSTLVSSVVTASAAGGDERTLATISSRRFTGFLDADWSPDGGRILVTQVPYFGEEASGAGAYALDVATGKLTLVLRKAIWAQWSPDGGRVVYGAPRPGCEDDDCLEIYTANADGSGRRRLTTNESSEYTPTWSPDGERIVFASDRNYPQGERTELYSMLADGSCMTWLTNGTAESFAPDFGPPNGPTDPGACGATPREPLLETDVSEATAYKRVPLWWVGPRMGNLLLSDVVTETGQIGFSYEDCASYEPSDCPGAFELSNDAVCSVSVLYDGDDKNVARFEGALVYTPPLEDEATPQFFIGPTSVDYIHLDETPAQVQASALRRFPETEPPAGGLPRAELPLRFWRNLERTRATVRKYGVREAARRLRRPRPRIRAWLALDRRLREIGPFGRLDCAKR